MATVDKTPQDQLERIKKLVESSHDYFEANYKNYHNDRRFIFDTSLSAEDLDLLKELLKPQIEANTLEAFISRLLGEFAQQEPSIEVSGAPGAPIDPQVIQIVEGHMRALLFDGNNNDFEYEIYKDQLSGGFGGIKVWTEYENEKSFDQCIKVGKPDDVTLTGYDPLAKLPSKSDGRFYYENYPKTKAEFENEYPDINIEDVDFTRDVAGFNWSFVNNDEDILLICDFYEKKKSKVKIHQMSDNRVITDEEYKTEQKEWDDKISKGLTLQQPPVSVQTRLADDLKIVRYRFIENQILEYKETDFDSLPGIFVDGNSVFLKIGGSMRQKTRSYIHHARDIQRLKNMSIQTLANELENMVQHKWKMPVEGIPEAYSDAYTNNQLPNVVLYKSFKDNNPQIPLQPPMEIQRTPIPPEIANTITLTDQLNQLVLGSFDAALGINNNQLSGKAIISGATQSNAAAMPYIVGFLAGLNQLAQVILELIPKYYKTPRTIPVLDKEGKRSYVKINSPGSPQLNYDKNVLNVKVSAGMNFAVQQQQSLQIMEQMMSASPALAQFIAEEGLDVLFGNMRFRGADILKSRAPQFMQQLKQQQAMAQQGPPPNPMVQIKQQELQLKAQKNQADNQLEQQRIALDQQSVMNDRAKIMVDAQQGHTDSLVQLDKAQTERQKTAADILATTHDQGLKHHDQAHRHAKESVELLHQLNQPQQTQGDSENA